MAQGADDDRIVVSASLEFVHQLSVRINSATVDYSKIDAAFKPVPAVIVRMVEYDNRCGIFPLSDNPRMVYQHRSHPPMPILGKNAEQPEGESVHPVSAFILDIRFCIHDRADDFSAGIGDKVHVGDEIGMLPEDRYEIVLIASRDIKVTEGFTGKFFDRTIVSRRISRFICFSAHLCEITGEPFPT